jgi:hypothetical protein
VARASLAIAALALVAMPAAGQQHASVIMGTVKDEGGKSIPDVEITALKTGTTVHTDSTGKFTLGDLPTGSIDLSFRRLAFEPVLASLRISANDTTDVEVTLSVVSQKLNGVVVVADPVRRRTLYAFEVRRKTGTGYFITRDDIVKGHPAMLSDMMRTVPGSRLVPTSLGRTALRFGRTGRSDCPPQFFIDGIEVSNFNLDEMPPVDVEGIEIYAGAAGLPPEFNRLGGTGNCGTVVIWTRIPGNDGPKA